MPQGGGSLAIPLAVHSAAGAAAAAGSAAVSIVPQTGQQLKVVGATGMYVEDGSGNPAPRKPLQFDECYVSIRVGDVSALGPSVYAYVGLVTGPVFTVDPDDGTATIIGGLMGLPQDNTAIMTGLVAGAQGELYVALDVFAPGDFVTGIYKIPKGGGPGTLFASDPGMLFPNGFAHAANGDLLVTDSFAGAVHRVAIADGKVSTWVSDPALLGPNPDTCKTDAQFHLGANGIVVDGDRVLVTNSDQASIIEIPVDAEGDAGAPALFLGPDCDGLSGADGLVLEPGTGDILVPVNYKQRIIRIDAAKTITVLAEGGLLQSPATLALHPNGSAVLIANAASEAATTDPASAHPALLSLALD